MCSQYVVLKYNLIKQILVFVMVAQFGLQARTDKLIFIVENKDGINTNPQSIFSKALRISPSQQSGLSFESGGTISALMKRQGPGSPTLPTPPPTPATTQPQTPAPTAAQTQPPAQTQPSTPFPFFPTIFQSPAVTPPPAATPSPPQSPPPTAMAPRPPPGSASTNPLGFFESLFLPGGQGLVSFFPMLALAAMTPIAFLIMGLLYFKLTLLSHKKTELLERLEEAEDNLKEIHKLSHLSKRRPYSSHYSHHLFDQDHLASLFGKRTEDDATLSSTNNKIQHRVGQPPSSPILVQLDHKPWYSDIVSTVVTSAVKLVEKYAAR